MENKPPSPGMTSYCGISSRINVVFILTCYTVLHTVIYLQAISARDAQPGATALLCQLHLCASDRRMQWQGLCLGTLGTATRLVKPLGPTMSPLLWEQCVCFLAEKEAQLDPNLTGKLLMSWSIYVLKFSHGTGFWFCLFLCFSRTTHSRSSRKECCITFFLIFFFSPSYLLLNLELWCSLC